MKTMRKTYWLFLLLVTLLGEIGCHGGSCGCDPPVQAPLLVEAERELSAMRSSSYQHTTEVQEANGVFRYDCSGFLDYALGRVLPNAFAVLPRSGSRPLAQDFHDHLKLQSTQVTGPGGWVRVERPEFLMGGDLVAWLVPPDSDSNNTGHVMVVETIPLRNPERNDEWLVKVIDSTSNPHAQDSRSNGVTGLGRGTIGLIVDGTGLPVKIRWRGGISTPDTATQIAMGRIR